MTVIIKPMLAVAAELDKLKFPLLASPKYDGIRAIKVNGDLLSRKFKPIPNEYVRGFIERVLPDGVDGELIIPGGNFNECQSSFMSIKGEPFFEYHLFDYVNNSLSVPFSTRFVQLKEIIHDITRCYPALHGVIVVVEQKLILDMEELMAYEVKCINEGFEGIMVRTLDGPYKCGRSTLREAFLLKIKRFNQSEGIILSIEEQMKNDNKAEIDELGHTKRSSHQAGMTPADTLGAFIVKEIGTDIILKVGTGIGMTKEIRQAIWNKRDEYIGKIVSFKHQPSGAKKAEDGGKPRFPIWVGFRHEDDM